MRVWRNAEGREFPSYRGAASVSCHAIGAAIMRALGYELVEKEPVEFECTVVRYEMPKGFSPESGSDIWGAIMSPRLIPGKVYVVREKGNG